MNYEEFVAAGFTRGEQLVELVALDPATYEYKFYLLRFEQACNRSRCTPEDLLTEKIESGWTGWTLYADRDLEDTALDCLSCHLPFGKGTHKLLLMRQVTDPWMHWSDFRGGDERTLCPIQPPDGSPGKRVVTAEGLDILRAIEGTAGRYAGVPVPELHAAKSGKVLAKFLVDAEGHSRQPLSPRLPLRTAQFPDAGDRLRALSTGTSPTWDRQRRESLARGLPVPYYRPDVFEPSRRAEVVADRAAFLRRHAPDDASDVAASFIAPRSRPKLAFFPAKKTVRPRSSDRCAFAVMRPARMRASSGLGSTPRRSTTSRRRRRRRFARRLSLPRRSPELMPPCGWASCHPGRSRGSNVTYASTARTRAPASESIRPRRA